MPDKRPSPTRTPQHGRSRDGVAVTIRSYPRGLPNRSSPAELMPGLIALVWELGRYLNHRISHRGAWTVEIQTESGRMLASRVAHNRAAAQELFAETCRRVGTVDIAQIEKALRGPALER